MLLTLWICTIVQQIRQMRATYSKRIEMNENNNNNQQLYILLLRVCALETAFNYITAKNLTVHISYDKIFFFSVACYRICSISVSTTCWLSKVSEANETKKKKSTFVYGAFAVVVHWVYRKSRKTIYNIEENDGKNREIHRNH